MVGGCISACRIPETDIVRVLEQRLMRLEQASDVHDLLEDESIIEFFDHKDQAGMETELKAIKNQREARSEYKQSFSAAKTKLLGVKIVRAASKSMHRGLAKGKHPAKMPEWKTSADDLAQSVARQYLPPGSSIWRANTVGAWQCHTPPHARHSEPWSKHNGSSHQAMKACVRWAWSHYLADHDLTQDQCPIQGIF